MTYANNIKALQTARGLTIDQAAKAMGMSRGGYLKVQRGENRLTSTTISLAAKAFGVAESEIVASSDAAARPETETARRNPTQAAEYSATVGPDGATTLPAEMREIWDLRAGDRVEFFEDHAGGWQIRPRTAGPLDFLKFLPPRPKRTDAGSDEEALTRVMAERNGPPSAKAEK